ncbi:MAG TPA: MBL fold metallo-hydrolase [Cyclobacteriaceae bacterium]|nr:MBL fold metallo-hydrolase [Cyclobacteriaceae bacterium]
MKLSVINTGHFKLDGGAMFGVVPKSIWQKLNPPDERNLCSWAMRCLLVEVDGRRILIDNGMGDKQDARFFSFYYLHGDDTLIGSLKAAGYSPDDITDVFLTHLHFDHCGGGVRMENGKAVLAFPNATYWTNRDHWKWATEPNAREKASFLRENILPMQESGHLRFVDDEAFDAFDILYSSGHTDKMMMPLIRYRDKVICFVTDLIPSAGHIPIPYVMAYDTRPLITMDEKQKFLSEAVDNQYILFFEHDPSIECCTVHRTEKGIRMERAFPLSDIL